jgi:signal transduction histidine kinase
MLVRFLHRSLAKINQIIKPSEQLNRPNHLLDNHSTSLLLVKTQKIRDLDLLSRSLKNSIQELKITLNNFRKTNRELENCLAQKTAALIQVENRADRAKSEFIANISHELLTPLNVILGFTQLMLQDASLQNKHQQSLAIVYSNGEHLLALIDDLLDMSKIEAKTISIQETSFDLYYFLDLLTHQFLHRSISPKVQLKFDRASNLPQYIRTDCHKLRQVLVNLLDNGIKYTEVGSVTLRVSLVEYPEVSKALIRFEIEDTGFGIAPSEINKIFEAFAQGHKTPIYREGNGLGLSISQQLVRLLGGEIMVKSVLEKGSLFYFQIPVNLAKKEDVILSIDTILEQDFKKHCFKKHKQSNLLCKERLETIKLLFDRSCFNTIPPQWLTRLKQAAIEVDTDLIIQLIEQISLVNFALSQELKNMANNFEYDEIIELTNYWSLQQFSNS